MPDKGDGDYATYWGCDVGAIGSLWSYRVTSFPTMIRIYRAGVVGFLLGVYSHGRIIRPQEKYSVDSDNVSPRRSSQAIADGTSKIQSFQYKTTGCACQFF